MGRATTKTSKQTATGIDVVEQILRSLANGVAQGVALAGRAGYWVGRRHPWLVGLVVSAALVALAAGPFVLSAAAAAAVVGSLGWWNCHQESFTTQVADRLRAAWRSEWVYRRQWRKVMFLSSLAVVMEGKDQLPRLGKVRSTRCSDFVDIRLVKGQESLLWEKSASSLAESFGALECRVTSTKPGKVRCEFVRRRDIPIVAPLPIPSRPRLDALPVGRRRDGKLWRIPLVGTPWLIAGAIGAGKSGTLWSIVRALASAIREGWVEVWAADPKLTELVAGRPLFARYAAGPERAVELLEEAVDAMSARAGRLAGVTRKHTPSRAEPMVVILIDELAPILKFAPDELIKRADHALGLLLSQGRAIGFTVIAGVQEPLKATVKLRGLFPRRLALRLSEADEVDPVLGRGSWARGARCEEIPLDAEGCGWVRDDVAADLTWVRASWNTDADIAQVAETYPAPSHVDHDQPVTTDAGIADAGDAGAEAA